MGKSIAGTFFFGCWLFKLETDTDKKNLCSQGITESTSG
jgi:hypothetical protein